MDSKRATVMAIRVLLVPIVRVLSAIGITYRDFAEAAKSVYVEVALNQDLSRGRKISLSRVADACGITRREASRLYGVVACDPLCYADHCSAISNVLYAWHNDSAFLEIGSAPRVLPVDGEASLETLVQRYCGELSPESLLRELVRVGAIDVRPGNVRVVLRDYHPRPFDPLALQRFAAVVHDVARVTGANYLGYGEPRLERRVVTERAYPGSQAEFKALITAKTGQLLEDARAWLQCHAANEKTGIRLGVGAYVIDDE